MKRSVFLLCVMAQLTAICSIAQVVPAGNRIISLQIDTAQFEPYAAAYQLTDSLCATAVHLSATWSSMEPDSGMFNFTELDRNLERVRQQGGLAIELNLAPVNIGFPATPHDLRHTKFDAPEMVNRFKMLLDSVMPRMDDLDLRWLNIGNEYEGWLFDTTDFVARIGEWMLFYIQVKDYAKQLYAQQHPGDTLLVGTTFTYDGLTDPSIRAFTKFINDSAFSDVIAVNYYAIDSGFFFRPPSQVPADFDALVNWYGDQDKPIHFTECGYPSGDTAGSSLGQQQAFIEQVFAAWDTHHERIPYISFFHLTEWSWPVANFLTQALLAGGTPPDQADRFREYLRTIGLRHFLTGQPKPAFEALQCAAAERDFCSNACTTTSVSELVEPFPLRISPNPVHDRLTVSWAEPLSGPVSFTLINTMGQPARQWTVNGGTSATLETVDLPAGMYVLRVEAVGQLETTFKVVVR